MRWAQNSIPSSYVTHIYNTKVSDLSFIVDGLVEPRLTLVSICSVHHATCEGKDNINNIYTVQCNKFNLYFNM